MIAIEANSMELKDGSIQTSDQLTIKTQDKLNLSSAAKSKETVINAGKENNLVISDSMGNVTINALNQNDSTFDILLKDYLHTFVLNGNNYQQKIKMILDQNNQATIFIHGKEGQNQLDVDLTKNTGKTTITVDKVNKLGFVLSNKNDQYTIDRNGLQISNNKMNIDVKTKGIKKLNIDDLGGNNKFTFIDTFANTNVSSGNGNDQFYFGVITNKSRYATRTNEGYLSRGTSHNVTIKAGNGNNLFRIYSSLGKLNIEAGNGNDRFILKVFAYWSKDNKYKSYKNGTITIDGGKGHNVLEIIKSNFFNYFDVDSSSLVGEGFNVNIKNIDDVSFKEHHDADGATHQLDTLQTISYSLVMLYNHYLVQIMMVLFLLIVLCIYVYKSKKQKKITSTKSNEDQ